MRLDPPLTLYVLAAHGRYLVVDKSWKPKVESVDELDRATIFSHDGAVDVLRRLARFYPQLKVQLVPVRPTWTAQEPSTAPKNGQP
jgi:hypothetical protein